MTASWHRFDKTGDVIQSGSGLEPHAAVRHEGAAVVLDHWEVSEKLPLISIDRRTSGSSLSSGGVQGGGRGGGDFSAEAPSFPVSALQELQTIRKHTEALNLEYYGQLKKNPE